MRKSVGSREARCCGVGRRTGGSPAARKSLKYQTEKKLSLPFFNSTVTVSFWHFIRNLWTIVSRDSFRLSSAQIVRNLPDELHDCDFSVPVVPDLRIVCADVCGVSGRLVCCVVEGGSGGGSSRVDRKLGFAWHPEKHVVPARSRGIPFTRGGLHHY